MLARIAARQAAPAAPKEAAGWKASVATPFSHRALLRANIPNEPRLILDAARRSNVDAVRKLACQSRCVSKPATRTATPPWLLAAATGNGAILDALLVAGANVETRNNAQETPLMIAAANGRDQAVELLAGRRAALDAARPDQATALTLALRHCHEKTVAMLLAKGANPNLGGEAEGTPSRDGEPQVQRARRSGADRARAGMDKADASARPLCGSRRTGRTWKRSTCC